MNSPEFVFNTLGCWAIGCAPALMSFHLRGEAILHGLKATKSKILIVDGDAGCRERVEDVRDRIENELQVRIVVLDEAVKSQIYNAEPTRPSDQLRAGINRDSPVVLWFTSGTTGFPKACSFQMYRAHALRYPRLRTTGLKPGDVWFVNMPMFHGTANTIIWTCMTTGLTLAISPKFSVKSFWQDIHDSNAAAFVYVGETARYLLAAPPSPLERSHKLKAMHGNGIRPEVWSKFQKRFNIPTMHEMFSSTEGGLSFLNPAKNHFFAGAVGHHGAIKRWQNEARLAPVTIDYQDGGRIWRDPKTGKAERTSYSEGGEILVKCKTEKDIEFPGYWENPEETAKRFEHNVFTEGDCYHRSGDALRRDDDGRWFFMDRLGDTYRWKSENVSTAEVASVLGKFPKLVEANVYGVEVPLHEGRAGCAAIYVRPEDRASFDYGALLHFARQNLPPFAVPVFLRQMEQPTLTPIFKQDKKALKAEAVNPEQVTNGHAKDDKIFWAKPGSLQYEPFGLIDWKQLVSQKARL